MYCPKCRTEYTEGVTECSDCCEQLVTELPQEAESETSFRELTGIFTTNHSIEANFIKSLLESNGIEGFIENQYFTSINILMNMAVPIVVMVERKNEARAHEIIEQYYKDQQG